MSSSGQPGAPVDHPVLAAETRRASLLDRLTRAVSLMVWIVLIVLFLVGLGVATLAYRARTLLPHREASPA